MVNPGSSSQPPPVTAGSLSWKRCAGCGGKIADRFLLYAMDSYWHSRCLKCSCCQAQLGDIGTSCYTKSGMILCRNDYIRKAFGIAEKLVKEYGLAILFSHGVDTF
ncbi:LIM domain transcription factor LMO4 [Tupaia chinensis]|uniref:LIM domain transcription factor LMO4 n=1 Tax=Tupaia chinensis TaxID=246437 RepID=L8Y1K0_TUPCH|nr:LIM domain transcription factor LMO4 [Tupaia chinensis]